MKYFFSFIVYKKDRVYLYQRICDVTKADRRLNCNMSEGGGSVGKVSRELMYNVTENHLEYCQIYL